MKVHADTGGRADVGAGAVLFALGVTILAGSLTIQATPTTDPLGPRFLPRALSIVLMLLSALLIRNGVVQARSAKRTSEGLPAGSAWVRGVNADTPATAVKHGRDRRVLVFVLTMVAYVTLMPSIGYGLGSFIFFCATLAIAGQRRMGVLLAQAAGTTLVLYLLFGVILNIDLPGGAFLSTRLLR